MIYPILSFISRLIVVFLSSANNFCYEPAARSLNYFDNSLLIEYLNDNFKKFFLSISNCLFMEASKYYFVFFSFSLASNRKNFYFESFSVGYVFKLLESLTPNQFSGRTTSEWRKVLDLYGPMEINNPYLFVLFWCLIAFPPSCLAILIIPKST